jgi:hypothetical protein
MLTSPGRRHLSIFAGIVLSGAISAVCWAADTPPTPPAKEQAPAASGKLPPTAGEAGKLPPTPREAGKLPPTREAGKLPPTAGKEGPVAPSENEAEENASKGAANYKVPVPADLQKRQLEAQYRFRAQQQAEGAAAQRRADEERARQEAAPPASRPPSVNTGLPGFMYK